MRVQRRMMRACMTGQGLLQQRAGTWNMARSLKRRRKLTKRPWRRSPARCSSACAGSRWVTLAHHACLLALASVTPAWSIEPSKIHSSVKLPHP